MEQQPEKIFRQKFCSKKAQITYSVLFYLEHIKTSKQATPIVPPTNQPPSSSSALSATEKNRLLMQYGSCTGDDDDDDHELHDVDGEPVLKFLLKIFSIF